MHPPFFIGVVGSATIRCSSPHVPGGDGGGEGRSEACIATNDDPTRAAFEGELGGEADVTIRARSTVPLSISDGDVGSGRVALLSTA